jgi:activating signal cointegrator complex subunit 2
MRNAVESWKKAVSVDLSNASSSSTLLARYRRINALVKSSAETGLTLMTGSDYLESLLEAYNLLQKTSDTMDAQKTLTEHIYYCLRSLMFDGLRRDSMLLDHLYHMKSESDRVIKSDTHHSTLCSSLVCTTSFLRHLTADGAVSSTKRGQGLVDSLSTLRQNTMQLHPQIALRRRTVGKGKGKSKTDTNEEMHMHNASQVSKVHELFPDLPNKYILQLLDNFNDDTESVIAGLLEPDSLPTHLQDHGTRESDSPTFGGPSHDLAPHSTPPLPPQRKNVFDNDEFDNLRISSGHLHKGRKTLNVDQPKDGNANARSKAAILAALAAFDSDDDERDDTYDVADVGGTVDSTVDTDSRPRPVSKVEQNPHEESLYRAWKSNQEIFARDSTTRVSKVRQDLKQETGMSDEQIEGWAIMLKKDSRLQNSLEKKYSTMRAFGGNQPALGATRWQGETPEDSEEGEAVGGGRRTGQAQIRGHRTWGRGRGGGSTAGASNDTATQAARKRKEQGRGRGGASHHRREGRAKKMGRGMAGLSGQ